MPPAHLTTPPPHHAATSSQERANLVDRGVRFVLCQTMSGDRLISRSALMNAVAPAKTRARKAFPLLLRAIQEVLQASFGLELVLAIQNRREAATKLGLNPLELRIDQLTSKPEEYLVVPVMDFGDDDSGKLDYFTEADMRDIRAGMTDLQTAERGFAWAVLSVIMSAPGHRLPEDHLFRDLRKIDPSLFKDAGAGQVPVPTRHPVLGDWYSGLLSDMHKRRRWLSCAKEEVTRDEESVQMSVYGMGPRARGECGAMGILSFGMQVAHNKPGQGSQLLRGLPEGSIVSWLGDEALPGD